MSGRKKLRILTEILGNSYRVGGEHLFHCPKCSHHKKKLSINIEKDKFKCWICEYSGSTVYRLVRRIGTFKHQQEWAEFIEGLDLSSFDKQVIEGLSDVGAKVEVNQHTPLPAEFISLTSRNLPSSAAPALKFLTRRGLSMEDILKWKVGYCSTGQYIDRVIFPSFDQNGVVNYFVARTYNNSWKKYTNPPAKKNLVFNELYVDWEEDLSLVEGIFDAVVAGNSVPILGSSLHQNSKLFREIVKHDTPVYIALDADAEKKAMNLIKKLLTYDVELYKIDIVPYSDVGEMTKEEYGKRKLAAQLMDSQNYLSESIAAI
jgi:DNA primase